jgi:hypothetical protein
MNELRNKQSMKERRNEVNGDNYGVHNINEEAWTVR